MLVLTRRVGEKLCIGADVTVTVLGVKGGQVQLGTEAPAHVSIDREEVRARKLAEQVGDDERDAIASAFGEAS